MSEQTKRSGYVFKIEVTGETVRVWQYEHIPEGHPHWFHTRHEARADCVERLKRLARSAMDQTNELLDTRHMQ
jgi:hypothetical protein